MTDQLLQVSDEKIAESYHSFDFSRLRDRESYVPTKETGFVATNSSNSLSLDSAFLKTLLVARFCNKNLKYLRVS